MSTNDAAPRPERLLRLGSVMERTGLGKSSIYSKTKVGEFPAPTKLSRRAVGWPESAINDWILDRIRASTRDDKAGSSETAA